MLKITFDDGWEILADVENQILATEAGAFAAEFEGPIPGRRFAFYRENFRVVYLRKVKRVATV